MYFSGLNFEVAQIWWVLGGGGMWRCIIQNFIAKYRFFYTKIQNSLKKIMAGLHVHWRVGMELVHNNKYIVWRLVFQFVGPSNAHYFQAPDRHFPGLHLSTFYNTRSYFILALGIPLSCLVPCPLQHFPNLLYLMWLCFVLEQIVN